MEQKNLVHNRKLVYEQIEEDIEAAVAHLHEERERCYNDLEKLTIG